MTVEYPIVVSWSDEDGAFIADVPDLGAFSTHGRTPGDALLEVRLALASLVVAAQEKGLVLPTPTERPTLAGAPSSRPTSEYPLLVFWSDEDDAYIADVPDLDCSAWGRSPEDALREARAALADILADARQRGIDLPPPTERPKLAKAAATPPR